MAPQWGSIGAYLFAMEFNEAEAEREQIKYNGLVENLD
jgi:hypothetical protein